MQSVDLSELNAFDKKLEDILKELPEARRELHERIADAVEREVDAQVDVSGIHDEGGRVKAWQAGRVGSGGGYAAVSAVKGETGPNSPGAITNYLENGHPIRQGRDGTRSRAVKPYVDGFHFYQAARAKAETIAIAEAEKFADELREKLGGSG